MIRRRNLLLALPLSLGPALPPAAFAAADDAARLKVVTSFSILADFVREVGGPLVEVRSLVAAGADAHVYSPTPADARALAGADLVVINGLRYEGWMTRLLKSTGYRGPVVVASNGIKPRMTRGGADPHAWQDLAHARRYVENIRAALGNALPAHAAAIDARASAYTAQLEALERETRERIARIPAERRRVITGHDAFGYFVDAYGIEFIAPRGWSTDSEPSAEAVARIVRQLRERRASALLVETRSDPRLLERIAAEAGVRIGGRLHADALSPPGTEADTYLKLFRHNVDTLVTAIGTAPEPAAGR